MTRNAPCCGHAHEPEPAPCPTPGCGPACGCVSCGANFCQPAHDPCEPPLKCNVKFTLSCDAVGVSFSPRECGGPVDIERIEGRVRRRGRAKWLLSYPAWDTDDNGYVQFRFDKHFRDLKPGRYEFQIREVGACKPCGSAEITIKERCPLDLTKRTLVKKATPTFPSRPPGATPMFDAVQTFAASLCQPMERGDTVLRLNSADMAALCGVQLCKPVQLVLTDGINHEIVTFTGCTSGVPTVTRGSPQYKFPRNATVKFEWTAANATNALAGCP